MMGNLSAAITLVLATAASSSPADEHLTVYAGPLHYCGFAFSTDLAAGERIEVKDPRLDFIVEYLVSPRGGFGIYEGNAPQDGTDGQTVEAGIGRPTKRLPADEHGISYLVETGQQFPAYIHMWGQAFKGTEADFALLKRLTFGPDANRRCDRPTYQRPEHPTERG